VDIDAAIENDITVAEVTFSNSISVSEHVVMIILALVRNYIPSYQRVIDGGWNIADCVSRSYDLAGMEVGTVGAGRIGSAVLRRLKPFEVGLHYTDRHRLPEEVERELGLTYHHSTRPWCPSATWSRSTRRCTRRRRGSSTTSSSAHTSSTPRTARSATATRSCGRSSRASSPARRRCLIPQPAPKDHPWRTMPHHGMTPPTSGTSLSAQARYAAGTREILECWFDDRPIQDAHLIVDGGKLAGTAPTPTAPATPRAARGGRAADVTRSEHACNADDDEGRCLAKAVLGQPPIRRG
jgi:formate dehydrogenase